MSLKVGDKVRIKSKEWYDKNKDENGEIKKNDIVFGKYYSEFCGLTMSVNSLGVNSYMLTITNNGNIERAIICCEDWFEPISNLTTKIDNNYGFTMPNNSELKKSVTVNVPSDMEVSTSLS